jgi:hypothetical protein
MGLLTEQAQLLKQIAEGFSAARYGHHDLHNAMAAFAESASTAFDALEQRVVALESKNVAGANVKTKKATPDTEGV